MISVRTVCGSPRVFANLAGILLYLPVHRRRELENYSVSQCGQRQSNNFAVGDLPGAGMCSFFV